VTALDIWAAETDEEPLVVATSGSTGRPKRVVLGRRAVLASVAATHRRLDGAGRWLLAVPPSYVAGVQVVVRSLVAGQEPVLLEEYPSLPEAVRAGRPEFVSLVPTQVTRMVGEPDHVAALASLRAVLVGGGPLDPAVRAAAEAAGIRIVMSYGAAETAGGCVYDGVALDGVALAVETDGRLRIAGPTLFDGYDGDPVLTREVLTEEGWFRTSDAARIDEDGHLQVLGRLDDMIISGGLNVPGPAVARRIRQHAQVADAEVLGVPDPEWGNRVVAFVVPTRGVPGLDQVRDWVGEAHPRSWAPRQLVVLRELPLLENGKVDRVRLRELAQAPS
jgi:O-succinylbenzoic acid--CoA ligase